LTPRVGRVAVLILAIASAAIVVRFVGLTKEPFWIDEVLSVRFSSGHTERILKLNAKDTHPPLYYLGLAAWRTSLGSSDWSVRAFSVLWSLVGLGALALLARDLTGGWHGAAIATLLAALHPLDVFFAQEARMYSQAAALATLSSWILWRWMDQSSRATSHGRGVGWPVAYCVTSTLLLFTHYLSVVMLVAQGLFALVFFIWERRPSSLAVYLGCALVSAGLFVPWIVFVNQHSVGLYSANHLSWIQLPRIGSDLAILLRSFLFGHVRIQPPWMTVATVVSVICILLVVVVTIRSNPRSIREERSGARTSRLLHIAYPVWLVLGPVTLAIAVSFLYHPIFFAPRFSILVLPPFLALTAYAVLQLERSKWRQIVIFGAASLLAVGTLVQYGQLTKRGMPEFAALWKSHGPPDAAVFFPRHLTRLASHFVGDGIPLLRKAGIEGVVERGTPCTIWICSEAAYPWRSKSSDRELRDWLRGLGRYEKIATVDGVDVVEVTVIPRS